MRTVLRSLGIALLLSGATALVPAAAYAGDDVRDSVGTSRSSQQNGVTGWLGGCYPASAGNWGGGWCDGNGPEWTYRGVVGCTNNRVYWGIARWAGDRRASYATCPAGYQAVWGGLDVYLNGNYWDSYIVPAD
jgi:hypothetical protein